MKPVCLLLTLVTIVQTALAQEENVYDDKRVADTVATHRVIAVLPFDFAFDRMRLSSGMSADYLQELGKQQGYKAQQQFYDVLLRNAKLFTVTVQDIRQTNALLDSNRIGYFDLSLYQPKELAEMLNVDAVILTKVTDVSTAATALTRTMYTPSYSYQNIGTSTVHIEMRLCNGDDNGLLWVWRNVRMFALGSSKTFLDDRYLAKLACELPYRKKK